jgi:hypothetical protein
MCASIDNTIAILTEAPITLNKLALYDQWDIFILQCQQYVELLEKDYAIIMMEWAIHICLMFGKREIACNLYNYMDGIDLMSIGFRLHPHT